LLLINFRCGNSVHQRFEDFRNLFTTFQLLLDVPAFFGRLIILPSSCISATAGIEEMIASITPRVMIDMIDLIDAILLNAS
jgi:hypothetical protein